MSPVAIQFLIVPDDRESFAIEIDQIPDEQLWEIFTFIQPSLVFHSHVIYGYT